MALLSVKQRAGETFWSYLTRFNAAAAAVQEPNPLIVPVVVVFKVASKIILRLLWRDIHL